MEEFVRLIDYILTERTKVLSTLLRLLKSCWKFYVKATPICFTLKTPNATPIVKTPIAVFEQRPYKPISVKRHHRGIRDDKDGWIVTIGGTTIQEMLAVTTYTHLDEYRRECIRETESWVKLKKEAGKVRDTELAKFCKEEERHWSKRYKAICLLFGHYYSPSLGDCRPIPLNDWPHDLILQNVFDDVISTLLYRHGMGKSHYWLQALTPDRTCIIAGEVYCPDCRLQIPIKDFDKAMRCHRKVEQ